MQSVVCTHTPSGVALGSSGDGDRECEHECSVLSMRVGEAGGEGGEVGGGTEGGEMGGGGGCEACMGAVPLRNCAQEACQGGCGCRDAEGVSTMTRTSAVSHGGPSGLRATCSSSSSMRRLSRLMCCPSTMRSSSLCGSRTLMHVAIWRQYRKWASLLWGASACCSCSLSDEFCWRSVAT